MSDMSDAHQPVLFTEALDALAIRTDGIYIDGTFGRGGHTLGILKRLGSKGCVYAFDKDDTAIQYGRQYIMDDRLTLKQGSFTMMESVATQNHFHGKVDGILLDLGVSSPQLNEAERGFSFLREGPLDMRMDPHTGESAAEWINHASEKEIEAVLKDNGEESFAKRISKAIVAARALHPFKTTSELAAVIAKAHPAWQKGQHPATQSFQAIRIHINHELEDLKEVLPQAFRLLAPGGRLVVISFHSLEDRLVKRFFREKATGGMIPRNLPIPTRDIQKTLKIVGKAQRPSPMEVSNNPRARSAILRVAEKLL